MRLITLTCACFSCFALIIHTKAQCPRNELYYNSTLSPTCDVNCQDLQRWCPLTAQHARAGCYCQPNYARNLRQQCIPESDCSKDCFPNESPIAPLLRGCEKLCRMSPKGMSASICYSRKQRRCVCTLYHCRNRNGQCQKGS